MTIELALILTTLVIIICYQIKENYELKKEIIRLTIERNSSRKVMVENGLIPKKFINND